MVSERLTPVSYFYPRPPRGGRQGLVGWLDDVHAISIHALREEGDTATTSPRGSQSYFYPRPPRGGRPGSGAV